MNRAKTYCILLLALTLGACATVSEQNSTSQVDIRKGQPVVYVHPSSTAPYTKASLAVLPFTIPPGMDKAQGQRVSNLFSQVLLGKRTFPTVRRLDTIYGTSEEAIQAGRRAKSDLVLAGGIDYAMEGTEMGGARVELSVRVINVESGNTVWYISENMDQPMDYPNNSFIRRAIGSLNPPRIREANGAPALDNMISQIAVDMADVMSGRRYVRR